MTPTTALSIAAQYPRTAMDRADQAEITTAIHTTHVVFERARIKRALMLPGGHSRTIRGFEQAAVCAVFEDAVAESDTAPVVLALVAAGQRYASNASDAELGAAFRAAMDLAVDLAVRLNVDAMDEGCPVQKMYGVRA